MQIHIIAVGERMPEWVEAGYAEYAKRLPHECRLTLHEIPAGKRTKGADLERLTRARGSTPAGCNSGGQPGGGTGPQRPGTGHRSLAGRIEKATRGRCDLALLVGGPEGLAPECLTAAHERWSLSKLTLAHPAGARGAGRAAVSRLEYR